MYEDLIHCNALYHFCLLCCTWKAFEKSSGVIIWLLTRKDGFLCMLHIWQSLFPILNIDVSKIFSDPFLILISCLPISKNLFFCVQPTMGAGMSVELQIEKCCNCKMQHSSSLGIHNFFNSNQFKLFAFPPYNENRIHSNASASDTTFSISWSPNISLSYMEKSNIFEQRGFSLSFITDWSSVWDAPMLACLITFWFLFHCSSSLGRDVWKSLPSKRQSFTTLRFSYSWACLRLLNDFHIYFLYLVGTVVLIYLDLIDSIFVLILKWKQWVGR